MSGVTDECVSARTERLGRVLRVIGSTGADAIPLLSDSNDAWRLGDAVLRICYRGDVHRFQRDGLVAAAAPASVRAPRLLDQGQVGELAWQLTAWVDGTPLGLVWPNLGLAERRRAIGQLGESLAQLNSYHFPAAVRAALGVPRPVGELTASAVVGADLNPLPVSRARLLLAPAARLSGVDPSLIGAVIDLFDEWEPADPLAQPALAAHGGGVVVHGDAHPMNVLWNDGVVALLDWEWVRIGVPELEIEPFLHRGSESNPVLMGDTAQIIGWLAEAYPAAFAAEDLIPRIWLIELAHTLRHLVLWPPDRPEGHLPEDHPLRRLRRIARDSHHLRQTLLRAGPHGGALF